MFQPPGLMQSDCLGSKQDLILQCRYDFKSSDTVASYTGVPTSP